jgi:hypothetical protein
MKTSNIICLQEHWLWEFEKPDIEKFILRIGNIQSDVQTINTLCLNSREGEDMAE